MPAIDFLTRVRIKKSPLLFCSVPYFLTFSDDLYLNQNLEDALTGDFRRKLEKVRQY